MKPLVPDVSEEVDLAEAEATEDTAASEIDPEVATAAITPVEGVAVVEPSGSEEPPSEPALAADVDESAERALVPFDTLQRYLSEIRRYPLLSREEEHALAIRYKEHQDLDAAYQLVTANLRLVVMVAREYQRTFRNILDLVTPARRAPARRGEIGGR